MVALKLFQDDDYKQTEHNWNLPAGAERTLEAYYREEMLAARQLALSAKTLETDRTALRRWIRFSSSAPKTWSLDEWGRRSWSLVDSTGTSLPDPPIGFIVDADLVSFVASMTAEGLKPATVAVTIRHLKGILSHAFQDGDGCLLKLPKFPRLMAATPRKWIPKPDDISNAYQAAGKLGAAAAMVRALIVLGGVYGLRPGDLCGLRWETNFPRDLSRIQWTPSKTIRSRSEPMDCPVPEWIRERLRAIRKPYGLVFRRTYECQRLWRDRLAPLAEIPQTATDAGGRSYLRFSMKSLRRFANSRANGITMGAGNWLLGHAVAKDQRTNARHYSDAFVAPDFVVSVLEDSRLSEPFSLDR